MIDGKGENSKETYKLNEIILMEDMNWHTGMVFYSHLTYTVSSHM
jgi:hypothetical protein